MLPRVKINLMIPYCSYKHNHNFQTGSKRVKNPASPYGSESADNSSLHSDEGGFRGGYGKISSHSNTLPISFKLTPSEKSFGPSGRSHAEWSPPSRAESRLDNSAIESPSKSSYSLSSSAYDNSSHGYCRRSESSKSPHMGKIRQIRVELNEAMKTTSNTSLDAADNRNAFDRRGLVGFQSERIPGKKGISCPASPMLQRNQLKSPANTTTDLSPVKSDVSEDAFDQSYPQYVNSEQQRRRSSMQLTPTSGEPSFFTRTFARLSFGKGKTSPPLAAVTPQMRNGSKQMARRSTDNRATVYDNVERRQSVGQSSFVESPEALAEPFPFIDSSKDESVATVMPMTVASRSSFDESYRPAFNR